MKQICSLIIALLLQSCSSVRVINVDSAEVSVMRSDIISKYGQPDYVRVSSDRKYDAYTIQEIADNSVSCRDYLFTYENDKLISKEDISERSTGILERCLDFAKKRTRNEISELYNVESGLSIEDLVYRVGMPVKKISTASSYELIYKIIPTHKSNDCKTVSVGVVENKVRNIKDVTTDGDKLVCEKEVERIAKLKADGDRQAAFLIGAGVVLGAAILMQNGGGSSGGYSYSPSSYPVYDGNCRCPNDIASDGTRCGARSAYSRSGGYSPMCY